MSRVASVLGCIRRPALALIIIAAAQPGLGDTSPETGKASPTGDQLARMAEAVRELSYEGTLVYLSENHLETLHIIHRVNGGEVEERLVSLSGPVRVVTRRSDEITCELSDDQPISVKRKEGLPGLMRARVVDAEGLAGNYLIHPLGEMRVAGRETDVVGIIPRDAFRYGYRFYLDRKTGLPLKSDLMAADGTPIEQIMFAVVQIDSTLPRPGAALTVPSHPAAAPGTGPAPDADTVAAGDPPGRWRFESLPPGFAIRMHDSWPEGPGEEAEHFLITDHLAALSVFIEDEGEKGLDGATRIGAVHAAGGLVEGHRVTVVGQVPAQTVAAVLAGLRGDGGGGK